VLSAPRQVSALQRFPESLRGAAALPSLHVDRCMPVCTEIIEVSIGGRRFNRCHVCTQKFAEAYDKTIFLKFFGNANAKTKALFRDRLSTPQTPHFTFWRNGAPPSPRSRERHKLLSSRSTGSRP